MPDVVVPAMTVERDSTWRAELIQLVKLIHGAITERDQQVDSTKTANWHRSMALRAERIEQAKD